MSNSGENLIQEIPVNDHLNQSLTAHVQGQIFAPGLIMMVLR